MQASSVSGKETVSYEEQKIVIIPPATKRYFFEYKINDAIYRDCTLFKYPQNKNQTSTVEFSESDSPFFFYNIVSYKKGKTGESKSLKNDFYVNSITNYKFDELNELTSSEYCGDKDISKVYVFKNLGSDKFYIKYFYSYSVFKH